MLLSGRKVGLDQAIFLIADPCVIESEGLHDAAVKLRGSDESAL